MEDEAMIRQLRESSKEYRDLEAAHRRLDQEVSDLLRRRVRTLEEEIQAKRLKMQKLAAKDRMMRILRESSRAHSQAGG